jgi:hypothetical protein
MLSNEFLKDRTRDLDELKCKTIKTTSAKLFSNVRLLFIKCIRAKFNGLIFIFFLNFFLNFYFF